jgi:hypothetical protein
MHGRYWLGIGAFQSSPVTKDGRYRVNKNP